MTKPYIDARSAIKAALNVDARSLYKPASWQAMAAIGYREELPFSSSDDLTREERFQQDCMTLAFINDFLPANHWAILVTWYQLKTVVGSSELDRLRWGVWVTAGNLDYPDVKFARWAVANWAGRLDGIRGRWDSWADAELSIRTLKEHYAKRIKPELVRKLELAEGEATRVLGMGGLIERAAA